MLTSLTAMFLSAYVTAMAYRPRMIYGCFRKRKPDFGCYRPHRPRVRAGRLIHFLFGPSPSAERARRDVSDFNLFSDGERVINLDSEISDRALHPRVAKQKLNRP